MREGVTMTNKDTQSQAPELKFTALDLTDADTCGVFEGYASLFDREDLARDVIAAGAFRQSLSERGAGGVRMLYQHDPAHPIGVWERIEEDALGLKVRGRLTLETEKARDVLCLMRAGAIDGLSIGFKAKRTRREQRSGIRRILELELWEISIVTFPMMPGARVHGVKCSPFGGTLPTERQFERWLVRDAGFTRAEARSLMRQGYSGLKSRRDAGTDAYDEAVQASAVIRRMTALIKSATP
jgi:HK97 family phage prohead protease